MIEFSVTILGNGSAVPTSKHHPSSQLLTHNNKRFLIDCGEGTQMQMIKYKTGHSNLDNIFISHLHGDHYYGLIGLINSFHLLRREKPLHIFAPRDLEKVIEVQLKVSNTTLVYPLIFHHLESSNNEPLLENDHIVISCFPLKHSIPVWGFVFKERALKRKINKTFVEKYAPDFQQMADIKNGADFQNPDGEILSNESITHHPKPARSYAYCSDTAYLKSTGTHVNGVDLLYHEATFNNEMEELANKTLHSTAADAAMVAKEADAGKLLIGHFSARFQEDLKYLHDEAIEVFPNTVLSREGETYLL